MFILESIASKELYLDGMVELWVYKSTHQDSNSDALLYGHMSEFQCEFCEVADISPGAHLFVHAW